jgi:hypothetical protein
MGERDGAAGRVGFTGSMVMNVETKRTEKIGE